MSMSLGGGSRGPAGNKIPKGYSSGRLQQFDPDQTNLYKNLFPHLAPGGQLAQQAAGTDAGFAPQEEYAKRQFQEFSGQNATRFSGMGMGARGGSGFQNSQTQGAQDFASRLAMQRQGLQRQALQDLMGMSESLLNQRPYEQFLAKQEQPFWKQLLLGGIGGATNALGSIFGGRGNNQQQQQQPMQQRSGFQPTQY